MKNEKYLKENKNNLMKTLIKNIELEGIKK
jgi:hypothetical protein